MRGLRLLQGAEAQARLADPGFLRAWQALAAEDGKHHWFQQPFFCTAWYAAYAATFTPLLGILEHDGGIAGLMPMAMRAGRVVHAGAHQCEYQGWIAAPDVDAEFARASVAAVMAASADDRWEWKNVAPGTPLEWLQEPGTGGHLAEPFASPLLDVHDARFIADRLRGRLRGHRNRLQQRGLRYERVVDPPAARALLRRLAAWCDLRQAAAHASLPFAGDGAKLPFHERLLDRRDDVWLSALFLDEVPIAAHLGFAHRGELAMGIQGYDPREGRNSPGAILLFDIAGDVANAGATTLDLTPGGDAWKERYASHHRQVHRVVLHRSRAGAMAESAQRRLRASARRAIAGLGAERLLPSAASHPATRAVSLDIVDAAWLPAAASIATAAAETIEQVLVEHAAAVGVDRAADWMQEAMRRLSDGWRGAAFHDDSGALVLMWAGPASVEVDVSDPTSPRITDGARAADSLVVRADAAGGVPPTGRVGDALAAMLRAWNESPERLRLLTDAGSTAVRDWSRAIAPARNRRAG